MTTLTDATPAIVMMPEQDVLKKFQWDLVSYKVWAQYTDHLIDYMFDNEMGYEYGGITPWMGEGYVLY